MKMPKNSTHFNSKFYANGHSVVGRLAFPEPQIPEEFASDKALKVGLNRLHAPQIQVNYSKKLTFFIKHEGMPSKSEAL